LDDLLLLGLVLSRGGDVDMLENVSVHHIRWIAIDGRLSDHNGDVVGFPNPEQSDVEQAVGEDR